MVEYYSPGQLSVVYPYLKSVTPSWLILGGPADANEAQTALAKWPDIKCVGIEPNPEAYKFQKEHGWPVDFDLFCYALSDKVGTEELVVERGESAMPVPEQSQWRVTETIKIVSFSK